jgi:hypothetical protein
VLFPVSFKADYRNFAAQTESVQANRYDKSVKSL